MPVYVYIIVWIVAPLVGFTPIAIEWWRAGRIIKRLEERSRR